ncbi:MAG: segregation and condensation protein A [Rhodospirillales bacterium]
MALDPPDRPPAAFVVDVDGYEGPLDALLALARDQKVDLKEISILQLADQYLAFVAEARRTNLELAAEYLVMAAWLAYLKSRLLLPEPPADDEPSGEAMAAALGFQLRRLEAMRNAGARLMGRPRLGIDVFARGRPESFGDSRVTVVRTDLYALLAAYGGHLRRHRQVQPLRIEPSTLSSVEEALDRLRRGLGGFPGWENLWRYLPPGTWESLAQGRLDARSAMAATFAAGLELVKQGAMKMRQAKPFGPIYIRAVDREGEPT